MRTKVFSYWLPRLMVIAFAFSLVFPTPAFVRGLGEDAYILWLARLIWIFSVPLVFGAILLVIAKFRKNGDGK